MTIESSINALTVATTSLLAEVQVSKASLDAKVPAVVGIFGAMQSIVAWLPVLAALYIGLCGWNVWQIVRMRGK